MIPVRGRWGGASVGGPDQQACLSVSSRWAAAGPGRRCCRDVLGCWTSGRSTWCWSRCPCRSSCSGVARVRRGFRLRWAGSGRCAGCIGPRKTGRGGWGGRRCSGRCICESSGRSRGGWRGQAGSVSVAGESNSWGLRWTDGAVSGGRGRPDGWGCPGAQWLRAGCWWACPGAEAGRRWVCSVRPEQCCSGWFRAGRSSACPPVWTRALRCAGSVRTDPRRSGWFRSDGRRSWGLPECRGFACLPEMCWGTRGLVRCRGVGSAGFAGWCSGWAPPVGSRWFRVGRWSACSACSARWRRVCCRPDVGFRWEWTLGTRVPVGWRSPLRRRCWCP